MTDYSTTVNSSDARISDSKNKKEKSLKSRAFMKIIELRIPIIITFAILAVVSLFLKPLVGVNYDMNDYLPKDAPSTVALDTMEEQFEGEIPNARVMISDVDIQTALEYKSKLGDIDGVTSVTWLDDVASLDVPLELYEADIVDTYYKDNCALFSLAIDDSKRLSAYDSISDVVGNDACLTGSAISAAVATNSTVSEITRITIIAVAFILLVLVLTTKSWIEPIIVLIGLGVSVIINSGTNVVFGEISFVTNAAGTILQVAIALDFCVFLLHRYAEVRGNYGSPTEDMCMALCKSSIAIFSSACTVIIGFLALTVMRFQIGPDLGFALAKGILISLITVFSLMPALFVVFDKLIDKTKHRSFLPSLAGLSKVVAVLCVPLAIAFLILPIPSYLASTSSDINYYFGSSHIFNTSTKLGSDTQKIQEVFGYSDTYVLLIPKGDTPKETELSNKLNRLPEIMSIISYVDTASNSIPKEMADSSTLSKIEGDEYARFVLNVKETYEGKETFSFVERIRGVAQEVYPDQWKLAGEGVSTTDLKDTILDDKNKVDFIAVLAVFIVLMLATRSVSLPVILVFVIETSIWLNFSIPYFTDDAVFYIAYLIVSTVQLGVTVDYAILFTDRYKENRLTLDKTEALKDAVRSCTVAISTSGIVLVVVGFLLSIISSHGILAQLGHFLGVGVLISLLAVVFVLPGFLILFDKLIAKTTRKSNFVFPKEL